MAAQIAIRHTPLGHTFANAAPPDPFAGSGKGTIRHPIRQNAAGNDIVLFDLTAYQRFGIKGRGAGAWLVSNGLVLPEVVNTMAPTPRGFDLLRIGTEDFVALSRPGAASASLTALQAAWQGDDREPKGFDTYRDEVWSWFHICGVGVSDLLAQTCPVDLDKDRFALSQVAQTRVAQMDCVLVRTDRTGQHGFDIFFDAASTEFMLKSLEVIGSAQSV